MARARKNRTVTARRTTNPTDGHEVGEGQLPLPLPLRPSLGGDDFLVAPCNEAAVRWIDRWPEWDTPALAVAGPAGSGKTHLASVWAAVSGARFIDASELGRPEGGLVLGTDPMILDDAERLAGTEGQEQALFHLLNTLHGLKGRLLLTGAEPPARWPVRLPDLRSRLGAIPVAEIGVPDDALIAALVVKLFADRQLQVGVDAVRFLTRRMERSFEAASRLVEAIDRRALAQGRAVTIPLIREVLAEGH